VAEPEWKAYERQIYKALKAGVAADAEVTFDEHGTQRLPGRCTGIDRQIDVIVRGRFAGLPDIHTMIVDCKCLSRKVDVKDVEAFIELVKDVGAVFGLLVARTGFSKTARIRAAAARGIVLGVVPLDELAVWLPRRPAVAFTTGAQTATLTYFDSARRVHTETVSRELGERVQAEHERDQREGRAPRP
jgi:hypothetical protein